jgi:hypothetical protein
VIHEDFCVNTGFRRIASFSNSRLMAAAACVLMCTIPQIAGFHDQSFPGAHWYDQRQWLLLAMGDSRHP